MSAGRMAVFLVLVLSIWGAMHAYVVWRLADLPLWGGANARRAWLVALVALGASYFLARFAAARRWDLVAVPLEWAGALWMGVFFLVFAAVVAADVLTAGGWLLATRAHWVRGGAAGVALLLAVVALVQGARPPVVTDHEVRLAGLPPERDGLTLVAISDLHLGPLRGQRYLSRLVAQVNALRPDLLVAVGDVVDGSAHHVEPLVPILRTLRAPLGVWAVTGNHEYYAGLDHSVRLLQDAGWTMLRDRNAEVAPGLVLAGVDDLVARREFGLSRPAVETALAGRPAGACVLLSHSPRQAERAAAAGAGLMLSGHTHNGQVWPFNYLVRLSYPLLAGRYDVGGMPLLVGCGTGTWGPPMRLWRRGEILRVRLRCG